MKTPEHKIKKTMPFDAVPAFLRRLADAIEGRSDLIPQEWSDLAAPLSKLTVKGKRRSDGWEMKVKLKAGLSSESSADDSVIPKTDRVDVTSEPIERPYKHLKKRMKSSFKSIGEAIEHQQLPDADTLHAFLADSDQMTAFAGGKYGQEYYPAYLEACRNLAQAFAARDIEALAAAYGSLDQLKKDCHKQYK